MAWSGSLLSLAVSMAAALNLCDPDIWGYRMLSGTLAYFILGHAIYLRAWRLVAFILFGLTGCAITAWAYGHWNTAWNASLPWGWGIGAISVFFLSNFKPRRWDAELGNASYGTYLGHWIPVSIFYAHQSEWRYGALVASIACAAGYLAYFIVDRPIAILRRDIRSRQSRLTPTRAA